MFFFDSLLIFRRPRASLNRAQIVKKSPNSVNKSRFKKTCFSTQFVLEFSSIWLPKTSTKSSFFRYVFDNIDFAEISKQIQKTIVFIDFSIFEPPKIHSKSIPKMRPKKTLKNTSEKSILASMLASQSLSKSSKIASQSDAERSLFRDAMQIASKSPEVNARRRL